MRCLQDSLGELVKKGKLKFEKKISDLCAAYRGRGNGRGCTPSLFAQGENAPFFGIKVPSSFPAIKEEL
jgi:hypothetical protein